MLQQTQVNTVIPYFEHFVSKFPNLKTLAKASEQEVLSAWQGLGYYRRAKNLHLLARSVKELPTRAAELRELPGVGEYTAGAIASIAFGEKVACVDGNVERVMSRLSCDKTTGSELRKNSKLGIESVFSNGCQSPGEVNEALMELGALVCKPADPKCDICPLASQCKAFQTNKTSEFPVRKPDAKPIQLTHICVVPISNGSVGLRQIPEGKWWGGMWEFPRAEKEKSQSIESCIQELGFKKVTPFLEHKHAVTNYRITLKVFVANQIPKTLDCYSLEELQSLPMPAPQRLVVKKLLTSDFLTNC